MWNPQLQPMEPQRGWSVHGPAWGISQSETICYLVWSESLSVVHNLIVIIIIDYYYLHPPIAHFSSSHMHTNDRKK